VNDFWYLEHLEPSELTLFLLLDRKESPLLITRFPEVEKFRNLSKDDIKIEIKSFKYIHV
jgi:hypothetical protein